jgi:hypothetical protein
MPSFEHDPADYRPSCSNNASMFMGLAYRALAHRDRASLDELKTHASLGDRAERKSASVPFPIQALMPAISQAMLVSI